VQCPCSHPRALSSRRRRPPSWPGEGPKPHRTPLRFALARQPLGPDLRPYPALSRAVAASLRSDRGSGGIEPTA